jgi:hypothetical protein
MTPIDLAGFSEDELLDLNHRIVERLRLIRSARQLTQLTQLTQFSVGMRVEFTTDDGRVIDGMISRLNRQTATVVSASGNWRVSPSLLRVVDDRLHSSGAHVIPLGSRRSG